VPAVPSWLLEPIWVEFHALLTEHRGGEPPRFHPDHPLGRHRRRIPDRVVFEHLIDTLMHGSGYERIATVGCSDRTIRRRLTEWAGLGIAQKIHAVALAGYDLIIGLDLANVSVDGCITKAPCGGDKAGPSPVDRRKQGLKRSTATETDGVPLGLVSAGANRHDSPERLGTARLKWMQASSIHGCRRAQRRYGELSTSPKPYLSPDPPSVFR
jgi:hypothetical protein